MNDQNYIFSNFTPYQESKTSIGLNIFNHLNKPQQSLIMNNWFSNNLYVNGSITSIKSTNEIELAYSSSIGYVYNMENNIFKNMIFILGYNKYRFKNNDSDIMNMSYDLLFNFKFRSLWISLSYGIIDHDERIESVSLDFMRSIFDLFILNIGFKNIFNDEDNIITPYLSLKYKI